MMAFFDLATTPGQPWKNGAGSTQELACWPPGACMDHFDWRLSVATIARTGPFSVFPGVQRQIMLLGGDGVHLRHARGRWEHLLDQRWQPFAFDGDEPLECRLAGGPSTALNLILPQCLFNRTLQMLRSPPAPRSPPRRRPIARPEPDAAPWPVQWHAASAALCASARNAGCGPVHGAARSVAMARQQQR